VAKDLKEDNMTQEQIKEIEEWAKATIREKYDSTKIENKLYHTYNKGYPYAEAYRISRVLMKLGYNTVVTSGAASSTIYIRKRR
jgi:hypothetical protein